MLGTTKPPYTLALIGVAAARGRLRGSADRRDRRAARRRCRSAERLDREGFAPTLILFPDHHADARCRRRGHVDAEAALRRADVLLRPARVDDAGGVDGAGARRWTACSSASRRTRVLQLAALDSLDRLGEIPSLTWRREGAVVPHRAHGSFTGFLNAPYPAWDLLALDRYALPLVNKPYVLVETSRGCPYTCDFCVAPIHQGHKFRERSAKALVDRDRAQLPRARRRVLLSVGRHRHAEREVVHRVLRRADRAQPADPVVRQRPRRQPDRSGVRPSAEAGRLLDARARHRVRVRGDPQGHGQAARAREDSRRRSRNMREAGIKSFAFFIFGYPGETPPDDGPDDALRDRAGSRLRQLLSGGALSRARRSTRSASATGCSDRRTPTGRRWSTWYYLLRGNGLDERIVMDAINRAKRRFFLRPGLHARHAGDVAKLALTQADHRLAGAVADGVRRASRRHASRDGAAAPAADDDYREICPVAIRR